MLAEFVEKILSLGKIRTIVHDELTYTSQSVHRIKAPAQFSPETRTFNTLKAMVEFLGQLAEKAGLFISVNGPTDVELIGGMDPENDNIRFNYAEAKMPLKNFAFNTWHPLEDFIIQLLSMFDETDDRDLIIETLSNLANESVATVVDNKATQVLQVKTGLTTKANVEIKNPVILKPFRTFREVAQPQSNFILRYRTQGNEIRASLWEADGGAWQLGAIANIKAWLAREVDIPVVG